MQCIDLLMWHAIRGSSVAALKSDEALLDLWRCLPEVLRNGRRAVLPQSAVGSPGMPRVRLRSHPDGWQLTESTSSLWDLSEFAQSTVDTFFGERERESTVAHCSIFNKCGPTVELIRGNHETINSHVRIFTYDISMASTVDASCLLPITI